LSNSTNKFIVDVYQKQKSQEKISKRLTMRNIDYIAELRAIQKGVKTKITSVDKEKNGIDKGCIIS